MAISLITAIKLIPWGDVISAAPSIVQGADKLWQSIKRKKPAVVRPEAGAPLAPVEVRLSTLETQLDELRKEALDSSALIRVLAEQNAQLVSAVGNLLVRTRLLLLVCGILSVATASALVLLLR